MDNFSSPNCCRKIILLVYHNLIELYRKRKRKKIAKIAPHSSKASDYLPNCLKVFFWNATRCIHHRSIFSLSIKQTCPEATRDSPWLIYVWKERWFLLICRSRLRAQAMSRNSGQNFRLSWYWTDLLNEIVEMCQSLFTWQGLWYTELYQAFGLSRERNLPAVDKSDWTLCKFQRNNDDYGTFHRIDLYTYINVKKRLV